MKENIEPQKQLDYPVWRLSFSEYNLSQTEATCDWFDHYDQGDYEQPYNLLDEGRSYGYGDSESYAERNR